MLDRKKQGDLISFDEDWSKIVPDSTYEGMFRAFIVEDGQKIQHFQKKNVIVNSARKLMAHRLGDCDLDDSGFTCINQFKLGGDNNLTNFEMLSPTQPNKSDTDLVYTSNVFTRNASDIGSGSEPLWIRSYPASPSETSVLFTVKIQRDDANVLFPLPTVFVCAGLFSYNESTLETLMLASQTFPVMTKIPKREFIFEWEIRF